MKKIIGILLGLICASFVFTLLFFVYRYLWFSTETIPLARWFIAAAGSVITSFTFACYCDIAEPFKHE